MVALLYATIVAPIVIYLVFSVIEIWITYRITVHKQSRSLLFVQASTEVTHTILVFAYAQFMVAFADLLTRIGAQLYWPVALLMVTLLVRGSLYLLLFYRQHSPRWMYGVLLVTYLLGVAALVWGLGIVVSAIVAENFIPDTSNVPLVLSVGMPALAVCIVPIIAVYRQALKQIKK
ncbi:MAG: hypothetical protein WAQ25_02275 [Candidatus Saccharimonas sp.]